MTLESGSEAKMPVAAEEVAQMAKVTKWEPLQLQNWIADIQRRTLLACAALLDGEPKSNECCSFNDHAIRVLERLAASLPGREQRDCCMTDEQIKYMVNRFLQWRLPEDFNPDGGISFKRMFNEKTPWPMKNEPVGTNLFDAVQAEAMIRYLVTGMPEGEAGKISAADSKCVNCGCPEDRHQSPNLSVVRARLCWCCRCKGYETGERPAGRQE